MARKLSILVALLALLLSAKPNTSWAQNIESNDEELINQQYLVPDSNYWSVTYGVPVPFGYAPAEYGQSVQITSDGELVVAGVSNTLSSRYYDAVVTKLSQDGSLIWQKQYGGSKYEEAKSILLTEDGVLTPI